MVNFKVMHKNVIFSCVNQCYKHSMFVSLSICLSVTLLQAGDMSYTFHSNYINCSENIHCVERNKIFTFGRICGFGKFRPFGGRKWPQLMELDHYLDNWSLGVLVSMDTQVGIIFRNYPQNMCSWWYPTIVWNTGHGIHFIHGVYAG